jgi:hypothetical protein
LSDPDVGCTSAAFFAGAIVSPGSGSVLSYCTWTILLILFTMSG